MLAGKGKKSHQTAIQGLWLACLYNNIRVEIFGFRTHKKRRLESQRNVNVIDQRKCLMYKEFCKAIHARLRSMLYDILS